MIDRWINLSSFRTNIKNFFLFGLPLLTFIIFGLDALYRSQLSEVLQNIEKKQEEIVHFGQYQFESLFEYSFNDLNLVRFSNEFIDYIESPTKEHLRELQEMFLRILHSKPNFSQIRFLNDEGQEIVKVIADQEGTRVVPEEELQDKSGRYYSKSLQALPPGSLYVSDFDLNIEHGVLEYPYRPTIRFALSVDTPMGREGYLIVNFDGFFLLNFFDDYEENKAEDIRIGLIHNNRLISLNLLETHQNLVSSFFDKEEQFDFLKDHIDFSREEGRFKKDGEDFFYKSINNFKDKDFNVFFDQGSGPWVLLSAYNSKQIIERYGNFFIKYPFLRILLSVLAALVLWIIVLLLQRQESDKLLLLASGYISDFSHDGIIITDKNRRVIYCNPVFEQTFGYQFKDIGGRKPQFFLKGSTNILLDETQDTVWEGNIWDVSSNNVHIQRYLRVKTVQSASHQTVYYIGIYSEPKILFSPREPSGEIYPSSMLNEDSLAYLIPQIQESFDSSTRRAIIIIRITDLMSLRNQLTHKEEQGFIRHVSGKLRKIVSADGIISAPSSGLLLLSTVISEEEPLEIIMSRIELAISSSKFTDESNAINYISGVALSPDHGVLVKELIRNAYIALEALRKFKTVKYLLYNQEIYETVRKSQSIKQEMEKAFLHEEFTVVYQMQNRTDNLKPSGVEALVRWHNEKLGDVSPALFIPILEESNLIKRLGKYMIARVLRECEMLPKDLFKEFMISINLSSQEFNDDSLILELIEMVKKSNIPPGNLCFEITETVLSENLNHTNHMIEILHRNEISVAIDDFGTGYSSLGYLKKLQADKIKIDRMFIKEFPVRDDGSILRAITNLAHEIGMRIIVEGVETKEQLAFIRELGCPQFQGYYISKPVKIHELVRRIES